MKFQITGKLEVNLLDSKTNPVFVSEFLIKNRIPAVVVSPEYVTQLVLHRASRRGQYKIICALDFPKGGKFALDKIYHANPDLASADGFEILLTRARTGIESKNEMKALFGFLRMNNSLAEIRWCLGALTRSDEDTVSILKNMGGFPPSFVRIDSHLETPRATIEKHQSLIELFREHVPYPIKVSGNVDLETIQTLKGVKRFDVSIEQAEALVREIDKAATEARAASDVVS